MSDRLHEDSWYDPAHPPVAEATDHGEGVWSSYAPPWHPEGEPNPSVWHFCPRTVYLSQRDASQPEGSKDNRLADWYEPQWVIGGTGAHQLLSREPLHLEPSLSLPDCCGLHGYIRDGRWQPV